MPFMVRSPGLWTATRPAYAGEWGCAENRGGGAPIGAVVLFVQGCPDHQGMFEDGDLHSDLIRALRLNKQLMDVVVRQADMISGLLDRRRTSPGFGGVPGLDRREASDDQK